MRPTATQSKGKAPSLKRSDEKQRRRRWTSDVLRRVNLGSMYVEAASHLAISLYTTVKEAETTLFKVLLLAFIGRGSGDQDL